MGAFSQKELEYLREQGLAGARGYIATVSRKQNPQLTPVGFVADEERIYSNIKHDSVKERARLSARTNNIPCVYPIECEISSIPFLENVADLSWFTSLFGKKIPSYSDNFPITGKKTDNIHQKR